MYDDKPAGAVPEHVMEANGTAINRSWPESALHEALIQEIATRQRVEAQLHELRANFRVAEQLAHFGSWQIELTPTLQLIDPQQWSDECYRMLGLAPASIPITANFFDRYVHPLDRATTAAALQQALATRAEVTYEYRVIRDDGSVRYLRDQAKVICDEQSGRPLRIVGTVCDITDRRRAEEELRTQTNRLAILVDASQAFAAAGMDYQALLETVVKQISLTFGDFCAIRLITEDGHWLHPVAAYDDDPEFLATIQTLWPEMPIALTSTEPLAHVARTGQPYLVPVVALDRMRAMTNQALVDLLVRCHHHSLLAVPLRVHGRCIGTLNLSRAHPDRPGFTEDDLKLAQDLADRATLAISNAQLLQQVRAELVERLRVEEQLRYQANLLATVSDAIISTDLDFRVRSWNGGAEAIYGWSAAEAIGCPVVQLMPTEQLMPGALSQLQRTGKWSGRVVQFAKDRTKRSILSTVTLIHDAAGQPAGAVAVNRDITEQVEAEQAAQASQQLTLTTLNSLAAHICVLDETGTIIATNNLWRAFAQANGAVMAKVGEGVNYLQICEAAQGDERPAALNFAAGIRAVAERECDYFEVEYPCFSPNQQRWFVGRVTPLAGPFANRRQVVITHEDVTSLKLLEIENERLAAQFYQAQKMESIGRLAGGIAHDFNNLLLPIIGYADLGIKQLPSEHKLRINLMRIKEAGERASNLTRQILAFSRQQVLEIETHDLNQIITRFVPILRRLISEDIALNTKLAPEPLLIKADLVQIEQILLNLSVNARDAMTDEGTLTIETASIALAPTDMTEALELTPGLYALLTVSDTGHGMDAATQERIFEPFFTTKPKGQGTGLGLATVFGIIKQHQGGIRVTSVVGQGTTFQLYLPVTFAERTALEAAHLVTVYDGTETILVVEDDSIVRQLVVDVLRVHGYTVLETGDPTVAVALVAAHAGPIHLLLSDVIMPQLNGRKLYEQLTQRRPTLKALFISGYTNNLINQAEMSADEIAFLHKPFTVDNLLLKLRSVLDKDAPSELC